MAQKAENNNEPDSNNLLAAMSYVEQGWRVFPLHSIRNGRCSCGRNCRKPGKHPRTNNGFKNATTKPEQIREWWRKWPDANIGIRTGGGLFVLDIDPGNGGDASLAALGVSRTLPETLTVQTGGGGAHLYFTCSQPLPGSQGRLGDGLDTRCEGGYVVAPPSNHVNGRYAWRNWGAPVSPLPDWLGDRLTSSVPETTRIRKGERNSTLTSLGGRLRQEGKSTRQIETRLLEENETRCVPPLEMDEVLSIAASVSRYEPGNKSFKTCWQESVVCATDLRAFDRFILLGLSMWMDVEGRSCYPRLETIAEKLGVSREHTGKALQRAEAAGWIHRYRRPRPKYEPGTQAWSHGYVATLPDVTQSHSGANPM